MTVRAMMVQARTTPLVTLSGQTIITTGTGQSSAFASIRFNTDGTIDEFESHGAGSYVQIDVATDWIIPNSASPDKTYHVRVQSAPPTDDFTTSPGTNGDWFALTGGGGANREWAVEDFDAAIENLVATGAITFEISDDAGSTVIASNTYSLSANWRGA